MKLAFCLFKYFPYGGLQRDFMRIAKSCEARGHEIHVYTMKWEGEPEPGFHIHLIKAHGLQNHRRSLAFARACEKAFEKEQFDLIIGFNKMPHLDLYYAADVCYQARAQEKHSFLYRLLPRYRTLVALENAVFAKGNHTQIMLISPLQQKEFTKHYQTEANRFHLLPPGIARDRIAPPNAPDIRAKLRADFHIPDDHFLLLMVGSGFKTKGLDRALTGIAALSDELKKRCHFFIIGQDNAAPFQKLAQELKLSNIHFLGGRPDVPDFLLAADLLLHPAYHENTGTVLLEALAAGLPVLTVDVCGYAHYIEESHAGAVLKSPFSQVIFNQTLEKMLLSPDREIWRQNALEFARTADIYSLPEKATDLIEATGDKKKCAPCDSFYLSASVKAFFSSTEPLFEQAMALRGESFRQQKGRLTQKIALGDKSYFIKQHHGVGWREIFKNLFQLRLPVLGAKNEWRAIQKLKSIGVSVPLLEGYGESGKNPATLQSFVLMEALTPTVSLEELCQTWPKNPPAFAFKQLLLNEVARIARLLHESGMNHRDFYICHFLLDISAGIENIQANNLKLSLIDLHRAQIRRLTPKRWIIKDLAGLYFSSKDIGLTQRDLLRFMRSYRQKPLRDILTSEKHFWDKVKNRGEQLYRDHAKR